MTAAVEIGRMTQEIGKCRCGVMAMEVSEPPMVTAACHCRGCQKMSASAFSLTALVPREGFKVVAGEPVLCGAKTPGLEHYGCGECFTWMFTRIIGPDGEMPFVNVRSVMFDNAAWSTPFIETMTAEKLEWAETPAQHSFEGFPPPERFGELMDAYAVSRAG